jgi:hypothetical protein
MKHTIYIIILLGLAFCSCNRIKNKGQQLLDKTGQKVKDKSKDMVDKVIPTFDADTPDTKFNKMRFKDFLQVDISPDVKNIYCFGDAIGIDADYQFAFNCDTTTAGKIIEKHKMTLDTTTIDLAFGLQNDFDWWSKKKIKTLNLYSFHIEDRYYQYFWYDNAEQKAYYFDFDL